MSAEMDLSESRSIFNRSLLKREDRGRESLSCEMAIKIPCHLVQLLATRILGANSEQISIWGLFYVQLLAPAQTTYLEAVANGAVSFLSTDFVFSLLERAQ
jgi:hypothetical protein